ncbi:Agmatine deiminase [subsurface metagenome]
MENVVYLSSYLSKSKHGKSVAEQLGDKLPEYGYNVNSIEIEVKNEWCRDFMPIKTKSGKLVQFRYNPSYLAIDDARIPDVRKIHKQLNLECIDSELILDGGAIEILEDIGIVSDRVFRDNPLPEDEIIKHIKDRLELGRLIVVPQHPYDFTGHVDGLVRFINRETVLINNLTGEFQRMKVDTNTYRKKLIENWYYAFKMVFQNSHLVPEEIVSTMHENDMYKDASGIYLNFLNLDEHIIMPAFGKKEDDIAESTLMKLYKKEVLKIDSSDLAKEGGIINCVTWTY